MTEKIIEVEAENLEKARKQVKSQIPEGLHLLTEQIISDGKSKTARAVADTTEMAFTKTQGEIPTKAVIIERKELNSPAQEKMTVQAFDEQSATKQLKSKIGNTEKIKAIKLALAGKKGFLGIGKKPNQYEAEVFQQAVVEVTYKMKAKISATIGEKPFLEKDNMGTQQDSLSLANSYWMARNVSQKFEPYVLYTFEQENDARKALLDLDCIHLAKDTGKLICTETLIFGYYSTDDGKYEAILCGEDLTHELWVVAKESFARHNGKRTNDQEPEKRTQPRPKAKTTKLGKVVFVREDRQQKMGQTMIYRIHKGPDAASAKAFLEKNPVTKQFYYIVVETPEGNYCRDIQGIYKE